jgi:hypothetical protein
MNVDKKRKARRNVRTDDEDEAQLKPRKILAKQKSKSFRSWLEWDDDWEESLEDE